MTQSKDDKPIPDSPRLEILHGTVLREVDRLKDLSERMLNVRDGVKVRQSALDIAALVSDLVNGVY